MWSRADRPYLLSRCFGTRLRDSQPPRPQGLSSEIYLLSANRGFAVREAQLHPEMPTLSGPIEDSGPAGNGLSQSRVPLSSQTHYLRAPLGTRPACPPISMVGGAPQIYPPGRASQETKRAAPTCPQIGRGVNPVESALTSLFAFHPRPNSFGMRTYITVGGRGVSLSESKSLNFHHLVFWRFNSSTLRRLGFYPSVVIRGSISEFQSRTSNLEHPTSSPNPRLRRISNLEHPISRNSRILSRRSPQQTNPSGGN
jgi:hypothetical protein